MMRADSWSRPAVRLGLLGLLAGGGGLLPACASGPGVAPPVAAPKRPGVLAPGAVLRVGLEDEEGHPRIQPVLLEDYVAGCVAAELGAAARMTPAVARMYQVQAILCRTFASANLGRHAADGYDLCATSHCQLYRPPPPSTASAQSVREAVDATRGVVVVYDGRPIQAVYHAHCGGRTSAAESVWGGRSEPYLTSVVDPFCLTDSRWRVTIDGGRLRGLLNRSPRTEVGSRLDGVEVIARDEAERAVTVALSGTRSQRVRGEDFRAAVMLALGAQSMRSTRFWIRREGKSFIIEGSGSGHGVGLCQAGAMARAEAGESPEAIVRYYYPGTSLALR